MQFDLEGWEALVEESCSGDAVTGDLVTELISAVQKEEMIR